MIRRREILIQSHMLEYSFDLTVAAEMRVSENDHKITKQAQT